MKRNFISSKIIELSKQTLTNGKTAQMAFGGYIYIYSVRRLVEEKKLCAKIKLTHLIK